MGANEPVSDLLVLCPQQYSRQHPHFHIHRTLLETFIYTTPSIYQTRLSWMTRQELARTLESLSRLAQASLSPDSFSQRLRIQKSVYLMKALGDQACIGYSYSLYFHGPYSPDLARDYYDLPRDPASAGEDILQSESPERRQRMEVVSSAIQKGNGFLEAVTTIHSIASRNQDASEHEIESMFADMKPDLADLFGEAFAYLLTHNLVAART
jgi:uncharacterized protein YwgA